MIEFALSPLAAIFSHISAGIRQFMRLFFSSYRLIARNCAALVFLPLFPALASYMLSPLPCITIYYILYKCHSQAKVCYITLFDMCLIQHVQNEKIYVPYICYICRIDILLYAPYNIVRQRETPKQKKTAPHGLPNTKGSDPHTAGAA